MKPDMKLEIRAVIKHGSSWTCPIWSRLSLLLSTNAKSRCTDNNLWGNNARPVLDPRGFRSRSPNFHPFSYPLFGPFFRATTEQSPRHQTITEIEKLARLHSVSKKKDEHHDSPVKFAASSGPTTARDAREIGINLPIRGPVFPALPDTQEPRTPPESVRELWPMAQAMTLL
jgi:hypothetical protein